MARSSISAAVLLVFLVVLLPACASASVATVPEAAADNSTDLATATNSNPGQDLGAAVLTPAASKKDVSSAGAFPTAKATNTPSPTVDPSPSPTQTATLIPTATSIPLCEERLPVDDLGAVVTLTFGISRDYEPNDLVPLSDELPIQVTMGYPSEIRAAALRPLAAMIEEMQAQGLQPRVLSGYRSYAAQALAWDKWNELYPEHAHIISAPPGFSEHQLGTVVDFGSPELAAIVGQDDIEFHTYFYKTSEGAWLAENAHRFGFTLSYPAEAFETTGFYYEPWHYRYVGIEMAEELHENELTLTEYQLASQPEPCIP